jgi:hypothetical protein
VRGMDRNFLRSCGDDYLRPREEDRERWEAQARLPHPEMKPGARTRHWELEVGRAKAALRRLDEVRDLRARGIEVEDERDDELLW